MHWSKPQNLQTKSKREQTEETEHPTHRIQQGKIKIDAGIEAQDSTFASDETFPKCRRPPAEAPAAGNSTTKTRRRWNCPARSKTTSLQAIDSQFKIANSKILLDWRDDNHSTPPQFPQKKRLTYAGLPMKYRKHPPRFRLRRPEGDLRGRGRSGTESCRRRRSKFFSG